MNRLLAIDRLTIIMLAFIGLISHSYANEGFDFSKLSASINVIPAEMNRDVSDIAGSESLDDSAYQFQINFMLNTNTNTGLPGLYKSSYSYVSLRAFKFIDRYTDECDGASQVEGIAGFYGQRYMAKEDTHQGLGLGWYSGLAIGNDKWVECDSRFSGEEELAALLAAGELFYKFNITKNFYIEPAYLVTLNKDTSGVSFFPQIFLGVEF